MSWNYRVIKATDGPDSIYYIQEIYYDKDGNIDGRMLGEAWPSGDSLEDLKKDLEYMLEALAKPTIHVDKNGKIIEEN